MAKIQVDPVQFSQNDSLSFAEYNESSLIEFLDKIESKFSDALLDNIKTQENFSNYFNAIFPERKVEMEDKDQDLVYKSQDYINYICWCGNYQFYAISNQSSSSNMSKRDTIVLKSQLVIQIDALNMAVNPTNHHQVAVGSKQGDLVLCNFEENAPNANYWSKQFLEFPHESPIIKIAWLKNGAQILSACRGGKICLCQVVENQVKLVYVYFVLLQESRYESQLRNIIHTLTDGGHIFSYELQEQIESKLSKVFKIAISIHYLSSKHVIIVTPYEIIKQNVLDPNEYKSFSLDHKFKSLVLQNENIYVCCQDSLMILDRNLEFLFRDKCVGIVDVCVNSIEQCILNYGDSIVVKKLN
ncbi:hypothetical protein O9G_002814 [Rozella allomycis CSF55]|uniref:WD40 repeat-like protein n=1 Tax=Rozella allomycis (strain CSF55) TaxID=988480 RepID=A0A075ARH3_ROZAC|nr:hypothetical protein O9G_002814 [Rozella allomycis CSF55]|eukprot:EPZ32896.1 hypothetical protein O9G_002814 [Rozella allomycis CSF55]